MKLRNTTKARSPLAIGALAGALSILLSPGALAQGGEGGYAKITPLPGTMEIQVNNDGVKYHIVDRPITVSFRIQGAPGKNRQKTGWRAYVGDWFLNIPKADTYTRTVSLEDVYDFREITGRCEQILEFAAASQNKKKNQLRNSGWSDSFTYNLEYSTRMVVVNPWDPFDFEYTRDGSDTQGILVRCLGHEADPRPNKQEPQQAELNLPKPPRDTSPPPRDPLSSERGPRTTITVKGLEPDENETSDAKPGRLGASSDLSVEQSIIAPNTDPAGIALVSYLVGGFGNSETGPFVFMRLENLGGVASEASRIRFTLRKRNGEMERVSTQLPVIAPGGVFTAQGFVSLGPESYTSAIAELTTTSIKYDLLAEDIVENETDAQQ